MALQVAQIMSYYPKYSFLDKVIELSGKKRLRLYIDLKNAMRSLYLEPIVRDIIRETDMSRHLDVSIFASFLEFISFHKIYAKKRDIDLEMYFFFERGTSSYHQKYNKDYKRSRRINDLFNLGETYTELFHKVVAKNFDIIKKVGNKIPKCYVCTLEFLEADFIPYYLINRVFKDSDDSAHLIYGNDKDHYQILEKNNIYQFIKNWKKNIILESSGVWKHMLKQDIPFDVSYVPFFHAIIGDDADDIKGISGIGVKTLCKISEELISILGTMESVYDKIKNKKSIFPDKYITNTKAIKTLINNEQQIISCLYQVSYFLISEFFDDDSNTEIIKKKKDLLKIIDPNKPCIKNGNVLYEAFNKSGISVPVNEQSVFNIFH